MPSLTRWPTVIPSDHLPCNNQSPDGISTPKDEAVKFWINKKLWENAPCDLIKFTDARIGELIKKMLLTKSKKDSDSKLFFPDAFNAYNYSQEMDQ